jgi:PAS domain S-box-containing protein
MWRKEIEIILARQLASYLTMPIFIVDTKGELLYFNEPAEKILGRRFEETGWMASEEWTTVFHPKDEEGCVIAPDDLPAMRALRLRRPTHRRMWISGMDGSTHMIEVTALPLSGIGERFVGVMTIFWQKDMDQNAVELPE